MSGVLKLPKKQSRAAPSGPEETRLLEDLLAGNIELHIKVDQLVEAITNHRLNCQVSTLVDNKLWDRLDEITGTENS